MFHFSSTPTNSWSHCWLWGFNIRSRLIKVLFLQKKTFFQLNSVTFSHLRSFELEPWRTELQLQQADHLIIHDKCNMVHVDNIASYSSLDAFSVCLFTRFNIIKVSVIFFLLWNNLFSFTALFCQGHRVNEAFNGTSLLLFKVGTNVKVTIMGQLVSHHKLLVMPD